VPSATAPGDHGPRKIPVTNALHQVDCGNLESSAHGMHP
jgi:hypothetical protein